MTWNWQEKDWPNFIYDPKALLQAEKEFTLRVGTMHGSLKHINDEDQQILTIDLLSEEALKTSEIEGEMLNRDSLRSSIQRQLGLKPDDPRKASPAEHGISEMMIDLYNNFDTELGFDMLSNWHLMLTNGRRDLKNIGRYRTHEDPMQIISGSYSNPRVHYEAPASADTPQEMDRFIEWFNNTAPGEKDELPALTHIYFESIHPFEDGNGRMGRAISEKALSQNIGRPTLIAMAQIIERHKKQYYDELKGGSRGLNIDNWLKYFADTILLAQDCTQQMVDFIIGKGKFYQRFEDQFNSRQAKAIARLFREGIGGFEGGLSASNYMSITLTAPSTATRDLTKLAEMGALTRTGSGRHTRYYLKIQT
jgi:Fic family protein